MLSRVADSLCWLGRYLERADHTARLIDVTLNLMLDQSPRSAGPRWARLQACLLPAPAEPGGKDASGQARAIAFELLHRGSFATILAAARENARAILSCLSAARENARAIRERISPPMWEQVNRLYLDLRRDNLDALWEAQPHDFFREVDRGIQLFFGITDGSMCHDEGWHFLRVGRFFERATSVAALLDVQCGALLGSNGRAPGHDDYLEWLGVLRCCGAFETYCQTHTAELRPDWIVQFLLLDAEFPRSVRFAVDRVGGSLAAIGAATGRRDGKADRLAGRLRARLSYAQIEEIMASGLHDDLVDVQDQIARIQSAVHQTYVEPTLETLPAS